MPLHQTLLLHNHQNGNSMGTTRSDDNIGVVAMIFLTLIRCCTVNETNVNNVGGSIANVNTVASNLSGVNAFAARYRVGASNPTTDLDNGDLFYNKFRVNYLYITQLLVHGKKHKLLVISL